MQISLALRSVFRFSHTVFVSFPLSKLDGVTLDRFDKNTTHVTRLFLAALLQFILISALPPCSSLTHYLLLPEVALARLRIGHTRLTHGS